MLAYKKQDEEAAVRAKNIEADRKKGKKQLMEKFGFSDDEEEEEEIKIGGVLEISSRKPADPAKQLTKPSRVA